MARTAAQDAAGQGRALHALPPNLPPRGLSREQAARYVGISPSMFDVMVADGRMPPPKCINTRRVWDKLRVDAAFEALPDNAEARPEADQPEADQPGEDPWGKVAL